MNDGEGEVIVKVKTKVWMIKLCRQRCNDGCDGGDQAQEIGAEPRR